MSALLDEFRKLSELSTKQLLQLDPEKLDPKDLGTKDLLSQKTKALEQVRGIMVPPDQLPHKKQLFRQMIGEGLLSAGLIGAGVGGGIAAHHGLRRVIQSSPAIRGFLKRNPGLIIAGGLGTVAATLFAHEKMKQERERRIARARSILKS